MKKYYDIVITGGGMVGSVLACKLARNPALRNMSILLIESAPKKSWTDELLKRPDVFSNRVSAVNESTKLLLQSIDVWDIVNTTSCRKVRDMKIWGIGSNNICTTFSNTELSNSEAVAYIVENNILIAACMKQLEEMEDRVHVLHENSVIEYNLPRTNDEDNVFIRLNDASSIKCELLLGTDGPNSKVRQTMGVQYLTWNYNQRAVVATLKINEDKGNFTAWQKFLTTGPVALLPLANDFSSLVWTTTPEHEKQLLSLSPESFVDALNTVLWQQLVEDRFAATFTSTLTSVLKVLKVPEIKEQLNPPTVCDVVENSRASFPLAFGHAVSYVAPKVALVGDAAHRVHPLAGQGVNLGFGDVQCLDSVLTRCVSRGARVGDIHYLRHYETERQRSNIPKQIIIDIIQKVAGHPWSPLLALTNAAFQVTNGVHPLKKFLAEKAMT